MKNYKIYTYLILIGGVLVLVHFSGIKGHVGPKETSPAVPVAIFILIVAGIIFAISSINKFRARALKSFAERHRYGFSYIDEIGLTKKCNITIGLMGKIAENIVSFKEDSEFYFVFNWASKDRTFTTCLIEMEDNPNCSILILPLGKFPGIFKKGAGMLVDVIRNLKEMKLDNREFDNNFILYTDNSPVASILLTDRVISHTLNYLRQFRTGPAIWGLGKNMIAVCTAKLNSVQETEKLINYSKELKNYLIEK